MQCKMMKKEICKCMDTSYLLGFLSPQVGLLTGSRVVPIEPVESLTFIVLLLKQLHCGFLTCFLLSVMSRGIFDVSVESPSDLLRSLVDVAHLDVEVIDPSSEVMISSGRK